MVDWLLLYVALRLAVLYLFCAGLVSIGFYVVIVNLPNLSLNSIQPCSPGTIALHTILVRTSFTAYVLGVRMNASKFTANKNLCPLIHSSSLVPACMFSTRICYVIACWNIKLL